MSKQIDALKLALEALDNLMYWDNGKPDYDEAREAITAIKEALAQPEQEPVEWGVDWGKDGYSVSIIKRLADGNIEVLAWEYAPHPSQHSAIALKPLTAEQREEIAKGWRGRNWTVGDIINAIEAAHGIKE